MAKVLYGRHKVLEKKKERKPLKMDKEIDELVKKIADMLGETQIMPISQIKMLILALGRPIVMELLRETLQIEMKGGMMISNGSRRRTPGGVFFYLARKKHGKTYQAYVEKRLLEIAQEKKEKRLQKAVAKKTEKREMKQTTIEAKK
jgi:phosphorylated adapter RNA export protein